MKRQIIDDEDILYKEYKKKKMCENKDKRDAIIIKEEINNLQREIDKTEKGN